MRRWEIYWANVPFFDDPSRKKRRPVIIANNQTVYVLALNVTSHEVREWDPYDYEIVYWKEANLPVPSVVRVRMLSQLKPEDIHERIGELQISDIVAIGRLMKRFLDNRKTI